MEKPVRRKVLLADDVRLFLEVTKNFFSRESLQLIITQGGVEALKAARALRPDLVIMNLRMRDLPGDECCRRIKADPEIGSTPVILLVDAKDPPDEIVAGRAGCDYLLKKPLQREQLLDLTRSCLQVATRATPRQPSRLLVRYGVDGRLLLHDYSVNLSVGGIFLATDRSLPVDTQLTLEFLLPGGEKSLQAKGQVSWLNPADAAMDPKLPAGFGIRFVGLDRAQERRIRDFLQSERSR